MVAGGRYMDPLLLSGGRLVDEFIGPTGGFYTSELCDSFGLKAADLAALLGKSTEAVARYVSRTEPTRPEDELVVRRFNELVQLIGLLRAMKLDDNAPKWIRTPLPSFRGSTP